MDVGEITVGFEPEEKPKPEHVIVGPHTYEVVEDDMRCQREGGTEEGPSFGMLDNLKLQIVHCSEEHAKGSQVRDTVLHEAIHAILYQQGAQRGGKKAVLRNNEHEEVLVRMLTNGILMLLRDNRELAEWLVDY